MNNTTNDRTQVSPRYFARKSNLDTVYLDDESNPGLARWSDPKLECKIYCDSIDGWILKPAERLRESVEDWEFLALGAALSQVEAFERVLRGERGPHGEFFQSWLIDNAGCNEDAASLLWTNGRCGLFHGGYVERHILVGKYEEPIELEDGVVKVDPIRLIGILREYLTEFEKAFNSTPSVRLNFAKVWFKHWDIELTDDRRRAFLTGVAIQQSHAADSASRRH